MASMLGLLLALLRLVSHWLWQHGQEPVVTAWAVFAALPPAWLAGRESGAAKHRSVAVQGCCNRSRRLLSHSTENGFETNSATPNSGACRA